MFAAEKSEIGKADGDTFSKRDGTAAEALNADLDVKFYCSEITEKVAQPRTKTE